MRRLTTLIVTGFVAALLSGCDGQSQPNATATPAEVSNPDFGKNAGEMMLKANSGMGKTGPTAPAKK